MAKVWVLTWSAVNYPSVASSEQQLHAIKYSMTLELKLQFCARQFTSKLKLHS